ncbi:IQ and ubiquitin-like domain-containing protein [Seriola lalandi dorsalis]|uniref:IQ and ubiquitin-like domain-containing protein n=1 Tax=Seriola lalandi dorsalis TaxID=1841481 RepID=UPI000C6F7BDB|nr:IQ and ubiquitin-like domain-containing protein [Seriola lalandi dorsalis]XP_056242208.1 IQ and ubiquitin-like domain-containing protein isoform X1 [Seriola aureovittata]
MSEQREEEEQELTEEGEDDTATNSQPGEPGNDGEEVQADGSTPDLLEEVEEAKTQADLPDDTEQLEESQTAENVVNSIETDVLRKVEEAETQADLPDYTKQLNENVGNSTATVKVVLVPEGHVMTVAFAIGLSIQELKFHLAAELRVPAEVLQISLDGRVVEEKQSLMELGVRPHSSTRLEMSSIDPTAHPLRPLRPPEHDDMPDVITVRVQTDDGVFQEVVVEIERPRQQKAFRGGYRHRLTGVEYHHAAVQTWPKRRPDRGVVVVSRDTQTVELKSQTQQCPVNVSTQMTGIGCYVSCTNDRLVAPGNYITAEEYHNRRLRAVICLQSFARRWLAQQAVDHLRRERDRRLAWLELQERRRREEKEEQLRDRRQRWLSPQRREDFNLLYHALEKWRCEEEQQINSSMRGAERKAALCLLLQQETKLIAAIGRHRIAVQNNNYDKTIRNFLDKSAAPHRWRAADGRLLEMDSQHTVRARELRDLYNDVSLPDVGQEQRLDILMILKHTVMEHECQLTRDIVDLIDREVDLMTRGVKAASLEGLRKRISTLLLQYIKTPAFNPEVAKLLKVPQNSSQLKNDMFLCRSCHRYLRSANFSPAASARVSGQCRDCVRLDNIARSRDDFTCYKNILSRLRADEQRLNEDAKIPFLLQAEDVRYLVEVVWASRSAFHASSDLYNLVFVRWEHRRDWSPWNCILLSKEEMSAHLEVQDVHKAYEATFICRIEHKHMLARRHFSQIPVMAEYLDSQLTATLGNQLVSKHITMTVKHATDSTSDSAR